MFKKNGFTLIEMIIVITILGVICAIAIPQFMDNKNKKMNPLEITKEETNTSFYKQLGISSNKKYKIIITDENGRKQIKYFIIVEDG